MVWRTHRWLGLLAGIPLLVVGLTGSLLVFRDALEKQRAGLPDRWPPEVPRAAYQRIVDTARAAHPDARPVILNLREPVELVLWENGRTRLLGYDPVTARELGSLRVPGSWLDPIARLHGSLALRYAGRQAVGVLGLLMAVLACTGLVLWPRRHTSLHSRLGLAAALPLLLFGISGAALIFWRPPGPSPPTLAAPAAETISVDIILERALAALPGGTVIYVTFPFTPSDPFTVRMRRPGDWRDRGSHEVHLHPANGALLRLDRFEDASFSRRIYMLLAAWHFAELGGPIQAAVAFAAGWAPAVLYFTALVLARKRRAETQTPEPPHSR